jgi:hypothetical protein
LIFDLFANGRVDDSPYMFICEEGKSGHAELWDYSLRLLLEDSYFFNKSKFTYLETKFAGCENCITKYLANYRGRIFHVNFYYKRDHLVNDDNSFLCDVCGKRHNLTFLCFSV